MRSFYDSNGDGVGDFNGITQKLDYLKSLGVTALWLMPIQPSPSYHGYDVLNYYATNPDYGSLDDFKNLLQQAHQHDMHIIIDLVLNHTSSQHPWFIDANSNPQSPYRNWYVWSTAAQDNNHWYQGTDGYYYAYFCDCMPDLNYRNPDVTAQMEKMTAFWLNDVGVDGFRIDAAKHLIEEGSKLENTDSTHAWFKSFYTFYKNAKPDAYVVGEAAGADGTIAKTYEGQMDQIFNFELANAFVSSAAGGSNSSAVSALTLNLQDKPDNNYAMFLTNHDQNRVLNQVRGNLEKARVAAALLLTGPGTPFIYYGEEVGMLGQKPDEDIRLPMQWTDDSKTAGFSSGNPWRGPAPNIGNRDVADEDKDPASLLNLYRDLISLRKSQPALQTGSVKVLETGNPGVYAILRRLNHDNLLVLINLGTEPANQFSLALNDPVLTDGSHTLSTLYGAENAGALSVKDGKFSNYTPLPNLAPYSIHVYKIN